jgi:inorganic phosphate transporter, PiT family
MEPALFLVVIAVAVALIFDVINGFHDAANSIATIVSTRVLSPRVAVLWAAFFNFVAMFVFPAKVADTISKIVIIKPDESAFMYVVLAGLIGAIVWDLITWWLGLPTSSSHALIGGVAGAGLAYQGWDVIRWQKVLLTAGFIPISPLMGLILGFGIMVGVLWIVRKHRPTVIDKAFRRLQFISASLYSLRHDGNDAQKTMGIILALLFAAKMIDPGTQISLTNPKTLWIIVSCHAAMAMGTAFGGWRIVKTMGMKITKLKPIGGFCAETAGAFTIFFATHFGIPVSTTHTIAGAIIGVGAINNLSAVKWGVAARIIWSWVLTIPCSAMMAALMFGLFKYLHPGF